MNEILQLLKVVNKTSGDIYHTKTKHKWTSKLLPLFILVAMLPVAFSIYYLASKLFDNLYITQQQALIVMGVVFVYYILTVINALYSSPIYLYFSSDNEFFLSLPIHPSNILSAKFLVSLKVQYVTSLIFFAPVIVAYLVYNFSVIALIYSLLSWILLPIIPTLITNILIVLIMKFVPWMRNKNRFSLITGIISFAFFITIQYFNQTNTVSSNNFLGSLLSIQDNLANLFQWMPPIKWIVEVLIYQDALALLLLLVSSLALYGLYLLVAHLFFFETSTAIFVEKSRKKFTTKQLTTKTRSTTLEVFKWEIKQIFRCPAYLLNLLLSSFTLPIVLFISLFSGLNLDNIQYAMQFITASYFLEVEPTVYIGIALGCVSGFIMSTSNVISATAITREAKQIDNIKSFPIDGFSYIKGKLLFPLILSSGANVLITVLCTILLDPPLLFIITMFVTATLSSLLVNQLGILIDLLRPKLNWTSEVQAVKQSLNSFLAVMASLLLFGILAFSFFREFNHSYLSFYILIGLFLGLGNIVLYVTLKNKSTYYITKINQ